MAEVMESIDVQVPFATAYNQWTQFEEFPRFMDGVDTVKQLDDTHLHWAAEIAGKRESGTPRSPSRTRTSGWPGRRPVARATPEW